MAVLELVLEHRHLVGQRLRGLEPLLGVVVMDYIATACIFMAYIVMAYIVVRPPPPPRARLCGLFLAI